MFLQFFQLLWFTDDTLLWFYSFKNRINRSTIRDDGEGLNNLKKYDIYIYIYGYIHKLFRYIDVVGAYFRLSRSELATELAQKSVTRHIFLKSGADVYSRRHRQ